MIFNLFFEKRSVKARKSLLRFYVLATERNVMRKFNALVLTLSMLVLLSTTVLAWNSNNMTVCNNFGNNISKWNCNLTIAQCGSWSECLINGQQSRVCGNNVIETQSCTYACYVKCTFWSACGPYGLDKQPIQSRHCTNSWCKGTIDKMETQSCSI